jgi:hypothetical protein
MAALAEQRGWQATPEATVFPSKLARRHGFNPRVDLLAVHPDGTRLAIELEVSRADPVANLIKFLVAWREDALEERDVLVSMCSPHIDHGRRCLTAAFVRHLRSAGMPAFITPLLPFVTPAEIKLINASSQVEIRGRVLRVEDELDRAISIVQPIAVLPHRIHFAGDITDVIANLWTWNDEVPGKGAEAWGSRQIQYFVHDPQTGLFAPSKFCAFTPAGPWGGAAATMNMSAYVQLGEQDPRFDGHVARRHLVQRLAFTLVEPESPGDDFLRWHARVQDHVRVRRPVKFLLPPAWHQ